MRRPSRKRRDAWKTKLVGAVFAFLLYLFGALFKNTQLHKDALMCPTHLLQDRSIQGDAGTDASMTRIILRRLTPLECERLQGLPEGWTHPDIDVSETQ